MRGRGVTDGRERYLGHLEEPSRERPSQDRHADPQKGQRRRQSADRQQSSSSRHSTATRAIRLAILGWFRFAPLTRGISSSRLQSTVGASPEDDDMTHEHDPLPGSPTGVTGEGRAARDPAADGADLAPGPPDAPGPSVTAVGDEGSTVERDEWGDRIRPDAEQPQERRLDEELIAQEANAAASEAARIGGQVPHDADDPAMDPVYQAGGGEQDGWEAAEADLIENASHGDGGADPLRDALSPEVESDRSTAVYGESDRLPSTEVVDDPEVRGDDPAEGPDLAADRNPQPRPDR